MFVQTLTLRIILISSSFILCQSYQPDQVLRLPGLTNDIPFKTYSGYLDASEGVHLHYVFMESQRNPGKDPLLLWLNGGPGCSSLIGLFTEQGPYRVNEDGTGLDENPYSWNKISNMLFLESPAGVGFSYSDSRNYTTDDDATSLDNLLALKSFFKKFPQFKSNDFHLTGESYAGIYIPTLSVRLLQEPDIRYKGFAIGNGLMDEELDDKTLISFAYHHGLIDRTIWSNIVKYCCQGSLLEESCVLFGRNTDTCGEWLSKLDPKLLPNRALDIYNIYNRCPNASEPDMNPWFEPKYSLNGWSLLSKALDRQIEFNINSPSCSIEQDLKDYLNRTDVRQALNVPMNIPKWSQCNDHITYDKLHRSVKNQVMESIKTGKRGLIYSGDVDMRCDFISSQIFVENLGFPAISAYSPWFVNNKLAGFAKHFQGLTLATVHGAGHMVPTDRPAEALEMMRIFLDNENFTSIDHSSHH